MLKREVGPVHRTSWVWLLVLLVPLSSAVGSCITKCSGHSKTDIAKLTEEKLARELYPLWLVTHADQPCPTLDELLQLDGRRDTKDPWGSPYWRGCGPGAQIWVVSAGEDARFGTADDIDSRH